MNVNYNNLYCDYIGATGGYSISDYIDITSNTLAINSSNFTLGTSNILNDKIYITSNILNDKITNVDVKYNIINPYSDNSLIKIIVDEYSNSNVYINNPFNFGKIYFNTSNQLSTNKLYTRIDYDNKLYVYFPGSLLPPKFPEWWCVEEKLSSIFDVNTGQDTAITGLGLAINEVWDAVGIVEGQISQLQIFTLLDTANSRIALAINGFTLAQNILTGATAFTIAIAGYALGVALYINNNYVSTNLLNQITSNLEYTYEEKTNLTNEIIKDQYSNCLLMSSNLSNLNILNGFINSNIQTQQYINSLNTIDFRIDNINISNIYVSSNVLSNLNINHGFINSNITSEQYIKTLKCDTLNLNTGNITNINGITANELIANGKIKENNKFLDTTYLTSNHIYNLAYNYTEERRYPSKAFTTVSPETSITLLENLVYYEKLYLDTNSISYGSGFYEVYSSSTYGSTNQKSKLFNYITTVESGYPRWGISLYNSGTGNYQGNDSIDGSYYGDWVIIKLPQSIMLTRYKIYQRTDSTFAQKSPSEWKVYGSNDGITFTEITEASQMTRLISSDYTFGFYEKTLNPSFTTQYQWIGFVFNKLLSVSGHTELLFSELQIFGKEIISNSIVSNIYTTSNAVKGIVRYEMPDVGKRQAFYVSIPNTATYYDGVSATTYYKYDLDLRNYTKTQTIALTSDLMRIFKIRFWYVPSYFGSYIYGEPYVNSYEVYMSYKANPVINRPETAGLNIYSVGFPDNTKLANILPNQLMLLRNVNSSLDYLTIVSRTAPCDIYVIIEDMLY
jgi:hypothetical protein